MSEDKDTNILESDYIPTVFELPPNDKDIFGVKYDPVFINNKDYPKFSYGFHHFIHANKDKMEILKQFDGKKKVYLVMNKYERYIDNSKEDINTIANDFFGIKEKDLKILSRAFFKLWEIYMVFDLIPEDTGFTSAHLAEGPGSFVQATAMYREKYGKSASNDKYYAITIHSEKDSVQPIDKKLTDKYKNIILHKTYQKSVARGSGDKDNGDLTKKKTIKLFGGNFENTKADLVTADGGFEWKNENTQEQEAFPLILGQAVTAIRIQKPGGSFVCKIFESFTESTAKLIYLLGSFYEKVYIYKPFMSRKSNSEKYLVCIGYKYKTDTKEKMERIKILENILTLIRKNKGDYLYDFFTDFKLPRNFTSTLTKINTDVSNKQLISINSISDFINKQNYYGDVYQESRKQQIEAARFWTGKFLPESKELKKVKKDINTFIEDHIKYNKSRVKILDNVLD